MVSQLCHTLPFHLFCTPFLPACFPHCAQVPKRYPTPFTKLPPTPPPDISQLKHRFLGDVCPEDTPSRFGWSPPGGSDDKEPTCNVGDLDSTPGLGRSPGEGHGNPLQYSCLENPMDRGAWQATVHGVAKSQTRLSDSAQQHPILTHYRSNYIKLLVLSF